MSIEALRSRNRNLVMVGDISVVSLLVNSMAISTGPFYAIKMRAMNLFL